MGYDSDDDDDDDYDESGHTPKEIAARFAGGTLSAVAVAALGPAIPFVAAAAFIAYMVLSDSDNSGGKK